MTWRAITHSILVGIRPELEVAPALISTQQRLRSDFGVLAGMMHPTRFHFSLAGLYADVLLPERAWIEHLSAILSDVRMAPFKVTLNTLMTFVVPKEVRPIVLAGEEGVIGISMLGDAISSMLRSECVDHGKTKTPHLTLAWSEIVIPEHYVERTTWTVREFVLIHSHQGAGRHEILGRFPLIA